MPEKQMLLPFPRDFRYKSLRSLKRGDASGMLEWMHDPSTAAMFSKDFASATTETAISFIESTWHDRASLHLAVAGLNDEYEGTISLKDIDFRNSRAEYAIAMRMRSRGTGSAARATHDLLCVAFDILGLHTVYLNVLERNTRAIRFYEKIGFNKEGVSRDAIRDTAGNYSNLIWYSAISDR